MPTDRRASHLRSWSGPQGSTAGVTIIKGVNGSSVYRLDVAPTDHSADSRDNLLAELAQQQATRLNKP